MSVKTKQLNKNKSKNFYMVTSGPRRRHLFDGQGDKGQIWISALLYTLIAAVSIVFILEAGTPLIEGMRDRSVFTKTKNQLIALDQHIEEVAAEGQGSQRIVPIEIDRGNLYLEDNEFKWELETDTKILEPRSSQKLGNLIISADSNVITSSNNTNYVLENNRIKVVFFKGNGTKDVPADITTDTIIESVHFIETNTTIPGNFSFVVAGDTTSTTGTGYVELPETGSYLGSASYVAHVNSENFVYDLELTLESGADFLRSRIKNFRAK
jgi:hypothetical protein